MIAWWGKCADTLNTLVCTCGKEITKKQKRNVYAVRVTFHPVQCAVLTP